MSGSALAEDTRTKLLDAAGEVFAESGFQSATVREICHRAGVNAALINYHFGDKQALYAEVLRHSIGSVNEEIRAVESGAPPEEIVRELVRASMQRMYRPNRPAWHFQLMVHEIKQPTAAMNEVMDLTMRPIYDRFRAVIGSMLGLPADDEKTRLCAHSIISQIVHYMQAKAVNARLWPELELTPERIAQIGVHIADFSLAYLQQTACASDPLRTKK